MLDNYLNYLSFQPTSQVDSFQLIYLFIYIDNMMFYNSIMIGLKSMATIIIILSALLVFTHTQSDLFSLSLWKDYNFNSPHLIFTNSILPHRFQLINRVSSDWKNTHHYAQNYSFVEYFKGQDKLQVISNQQNIVIDGFIHGQEILISQSIWEESNNYELIFIQNELPQKKGKNIGKFIVDFDTIIYRERDSSFGDNISAEIQTAKQQAKRRIQLFMENNKIPSIYLEYTIKMVFDTISQICIDPHSQLSYFGLCFNAHEGKRHAPQFQIDIRYSFLIIDLLFQQYTSTAFWLFEQLINLIQDKLFYGDGHFVEIPQHISIIKTYTSNLDKMFPSLDIQKLRKFHIRVKALLNGLMNQMLLADVNNLQQEINYRQTKKMHPTLLRMISLKWKSNNRKNTISSIYEQSFTPDYFYNLADQRLDTCVSKTAWLTATAYEYISFIKKHGSPDDKQALQQPISLFKILQHVSKSDNYAKQGKFYSITVAEGVRIYATQIGYQSFFPYIYNLTNVSPQEMLRNITTPYGLASLNLDHHKFNSQFQFRGNVHLYFNFKILFDMKSKAQAASDLKLLGIITKHIKNIQQYIIKNERSQKSFTMWSSSGVGLRNRKDLSLIKALFLSQK